MKTEFKIGNGLSMLDRIKKYNQPYFVSMEGQTKYILFDNVVYKFGESNELNKGSFLFSMVKKDFQSFLDTNHHPKLESGYKTIYSSFKGISNETVYCYDINHAYWRIAFLQGYISEKTYKHGLKLKDMGGDMKQVYCKALAVQGQTKRLVGYIGVKKTGEVFLLEKPLKHKELYCDIINRTAKIMDEISFVLGNDFIDYQIDGIRFHGKKNCKKVEQMLNSYNLTFKKTWKKHQKS